MSQPPAPATSRPNRVLVVVLGLVAVIAVVAGVLSLTRSTPDYDRGTPEGVVQAYLSAVADGDHQEATGFLASDSPCEVTDLDRAGVPDEFRALLRDSETDGDTAQVDVEVVLSGGGPFEGAEYSEKHTFRLTRSDQDWLITGVPWPMYDCPEEE